MITEEDVISAVVARMRAKRNGAINSIVNNGDGTWTFQTPNTFDIYANYYISINSVSYKVSACTQDTSFTVISSDDLSLETSWQALTPFFYFGNPIDKSTEIENSGFDADAKWPAIIMFEIENADISANVSDNIERTPDFRLFFMSQNPYYNKTIEQTYNDVMRDMSALMVEFLNECQFYPGIDLGAPLNVHGKTTKWSKWFVTAITSAGQKNALTIFNGYFSGHELKIPIPLSRTLNLYCLDDWRNKI